MSGERERRYINVNVCLEQKEFKDNFKKLDKGTLFYNPIRANRFIVELPIEVDIPSWQIVNISLPNYAYGRFNETTITFRDFINHGEDTTSKRIYKNLITKENFEIKVRLLNEIGCVIQTYLIDVLKVNRYDFGSLTYENEDSAKIEVAFDTLSFKII